MLLLFMAVRNMHNLIILFFLVISLEGYSQKNIRIDESLKQNIDLENLEAPLELWINFLSSKDDKDGAKFWNICSLTLLVNFPVFQTI
jgi:hypothetical protein